MTTRFEYQPLCQSKCEIRLLKLLPSATNDGLIPACHVFHSSLSEDPKFVALSYVWGDAIDSRVILLEDRPIRVTKNLYEAMMALRPVKRPMIVWIDSLCINQSDYSEKSWQVGLMANIYRHACKVVAWLGTAADDSEQIMDYLNSLGAKAEACGMHGYPQLYQKVWQELALNTPAAHGTSPTVTTTTAADRTTVPRASLQDLFYSISGWHNQDNLLPVAGIQRLFTRPW
ncbi:heterokaryon incompatibility protein, partial [Polyplosphaeria fusca]